MVVVLGGGMGVGEGAVGTRGRGGGGGGAFILPHGVQCHDDMHCNNLTFSLSAKAVPHPTPPHPQNPKSGYKAEYLTSIP